MIRYQHGQRYQTKGAFYLRVRVNGKKISIKIADKGPGASSWADVEHLIERELARVNGQDAGPPTIGNFVETIYLPWAHKNLSAPTAASYRTVWNKHWQPHFGSSTWANVKPVHVSAILEKMAQAGATGSTLSQVKGVLRNIFGHAIFSGLTVENPVKASRWVTRTARPRQPEYSLEQVQTMIAVLEPIDVRPALAVALAFFSALRQAEIRGLCWDNIGADKLEIKQTVWRGRLGKPKTEASAASVPLIEPVKGLLEKLAAITGRIGFVFQNGSHRPLDLNSLARRVIQPAIEKAGIPWYGYHACRRGIGSLVADTASPIIASGLLRHANPAMTLKAYTKARPASIQGALEQVEEMANKTGTIQ